MNKKKFNFIITNLVTLLRVIGIFALIPVYKIYGGFATFLLSASTFLTDCIDGLLARELKSSTFFGSLFDAISDKAFLVVNMFLLMNISPLAIIPIFFELGIAYVQSFKYNKGMNIKSNMVGKIKMWIAGIVISLSYLLVDKSFLSYLGSSLAINLKNYSEIYIFSVLFTPLVLSEILTLGSYIKEYIDEVKKETPKMREKKQIEEEKIEKEISDVSFKKIMFEHDYYEKYKDFGNLKLVKTLSKKNKR